MRALLIAFFASLLSMSLHAASGELSIFVIKDGKPLAKAKISIDGKTELITDKDGSAFLQLPIGKHQAVIDVKEEGKTIAFAKHSFIIAPNKNTEVILTLSETGKLENVDIEASQDAAKYADSNGTLEEDKRAKAFLNGVIVSSEDKKPIVGARLFVKGSSSQAMTNSKGVFSLNIYDGNNTISIIHDKFTAKTLKIEAVAKKTVTQNIELSPAGMELEEFVVLKPNVQGSMASAIDERRNSSDVADVLSAEQFSKQGDSSAAGALKRASGLTLVGGKYVYVRGLGERYSSTLLNGLSIPSPEPTKRVVPLDLFPTSVIDSISIQKTYSANLPATFGGGTIKIRTKSVPDEDYVTFDASTKYNSSSTGKTVLSSTQGSLDILGYDDGTRAFDQSVIDATDNFAILQDSLGGFREGYTSQELIAFGQTFADKTYNLENYVVKPGFKTSLGFGKNINLHKAGKLGISFSYSLSNDEDYISKDKTLFSSNGGTYVPIKYGTQLDLSKEKNHGGLLSFAYEYNKNHKVNLTSLYLHSASDLTRQYSYIDQNDNDMKSTYLEWVQRDLFINQLVGEHIVGSHNFSWAGEVGLASRYEPGTIEYIYTRATPDSPYYLSSANPINLLRSDLHDLLLNYRADYTYNLELFDREQKITLGINQFLKNRELDSRRLSIDYTSGSTLLGDTTRTGNDIDSILTDEVFANSDLELLTTYRASDFYTATQVINAGYINTTLQLLKDFNILAGVRYETSTQKLIAKNDLLQDETTTLISSNILPAVTATYKINKKLQLRGGYSNSVSRPDFREFVESAYVDPDTGDSVVGYKDLQYTKITNYDVRLEYYFDEIDNISFAVFKKDFINPIEEAIRAFDTPLTVFRNAESAQSLGLELDVRKKFDFISPKLRDLYFSLNYALIDSKVTLNKDTIDDVIRNLTTNDRAMQGQSPYTINVFLGYDSSDSGRSISILYNRFGERIRKLGTEGELDIYEQPFDQLDFVWIEEPLKNLKIKFKISNLLDDTVEWTQGPESTFSYKKGSTYSLGVSYKY